MTCVVAPDSICSDGQDDHSTETRRLAAVRARDVAADGTFVYAVQTTGVYGRPSCAARPARAENMRFYETNASAERDGYRACKRCRPNALGKADRNAAIVKQACDLIAAGETSLSLDALAQAFGMSPFHFHRLFKATMGLTPKAYVAAERARRMRDGLNAGATVTAAIYEAGYGSSSRFYEGAHSRLGMSATTYRNGGAGVTIRFGVGTCSLGALLVAATDRGICAIALGDDPDALLVSLQQRFSKAIFVGADTALEHLVATVVGAIECPAQTQNLPLDVRGTAFQERVWQALQAIPVGRTRTYADIAAAIGQPSATRAVANACGANPAAVAIPCHRVVRTDGGLGGYRWGIARKQRLLSREAVGDAAARVLQPRRKPKAPKT
jgi:AraC family transcriptional regulator of adaptative response/methylated-DNA-[protein]-cysteine methyltransferase